MSEASERPKRRANWAFLALNRWRQQHGVPQIEHMLLAGFAGAAETRGLWAFLIERGLATEEQHQDYLDKGWRLFLDQQESQASKIHVVEGGNV